MPLIVIHTVAGYCHKEAHRLDCKGYMGRSHFEPKSKVWLWITQMQEDNASIIPEYMIPKFS